MTIPRILWNMGAGLLRRRFSPPTPGLLLIDRPSIWKTRIGAIDTDLNLHLNNASYLTQMESATWFAVGASGILVEILRQRWLFLVVSQAIRYRHPIPPLRPFHIHSTIVYWDADWLYLQHRFVCPATGTLYAQSIVRVMIRLGKATVSPTTMYRTVTKDEVASFVDNLSIGYVCSRAPLRRRPCPTKCAIFWRGSARARTACSSLLHRRVQRRRRRLSTGPGQPTR
ncbi:hypothetical protein SDRG_11119 [Saprolegnia diclina VS20]|uniref:Thioesterase n=1 Tax=Saprolegnia diclina (strain VS20) TaxID=1156394 RepID=T0Q026_SAPDV|nr:hypothetical protein SDRG_11119 [Saprolegnia diclina VS20]EQC31194.1 hypothetical protein SDRG_11119 [Saprolegnia diclina VS20]|eukprot:XP_008615368.1 hypothetical protein SDRG_11119 [Saprolegnia diclina VS20]